MGIKRSLWREKLFITTSFFLGQCIILFLFLLMQPLHCPVGIWQLSLNSVFGFILKLLSETGNQQVSYHCWKNQELAVRKLLLNQIKTYMLNYWYMLVKVESMLISITCFWSTLVNQELEMNFAEYKINRLRALQVRKLKRKAIAIMQQGNKVIETLVFGLSLYLHFYSSQCKGKEK